MIWRWFGALVAGIIGLSWLAGAAVGQTAELPASIAITASESGSIAFALAGAVGKSIADRHAIDVQVLPAGNDVARLGPLRKGRAQIAAMGIGAYFAQEGAFEFAVRGWGPQPVRLILTSRDCSAVALGVAADIGVRQIRELRGRRVGIVVGAPGLNHSTLAILGFGGLGPRDVRLVEFASYGAMWKALADGGIDAAVGSSISAPVLEASASPRGLVFPPAPADDVEGWQRLKAIAPYFMPTVASCGGGLSTERPVELPGYPFPAFLAYASEPVTRVRAVARAMIEGFESYRDVAIGAPGLALARQTFGWVIPFHEGAVQALREAGVWSAQHEAHNQKLVRRQETLAAAWAIYAKSAEGIGEPALYVTGWMAARRDALLSAGFDPVLE